MPTSITQALSNALSSSPASVEDRATDEFKPTLNAPTLPSAISLPELIRPNGDNAAPDFGSPGFQEIAPFEIEEPEILQSVADSIGSLLSGELPEDVVSEIERTTAERGISTGVLGQAGEFMTARSLGLTSLDLTSAGIEAGTQLGQIQQQRNLAEADINSRIAMTNQQSAATFAQLQETARQWEDSMVQAQIDNELSFSQMQLSIHQLISQNQVATQSLINDIIINNSRYEIADAEDAINELSDFMGMTDRSILDLMGFTRI